MSQVTPSNQYAVGQLWACQGRHDGEQPTLLINRIDQHPLGGGNIYHVTLDGLKIRNPRVPEGIMTQLAHAPVTDQTLQRSQLRLLGQHRRDRLLVHHAGGDAVVHRRVAARRDWKSVSAVAMICDAAW